MTLYELTESTIQKAAATTFEAACVKERPVLQRRLREQVEVISPDTLVIAEEFSDWEGSKLRIDLLGIDKQANLKRTLFSLGGADRRH